MHLKIEEGEAEERKKSLKMLKLSSQNPQGLTVDIMPYCKIQERKTEEKDFFLLRNGNCAEKISRINF